MSEHNHSSEIRITSSPLLSDDEKRLLLEAPDKGIEPAQGIKRYQTFEDWQKNGGVRGNNNFRPHFSSGFYGDIQREMPWMQRFMFLYPDMYQLLNEITDTNLYRTEEEERLYWEAYEKIADLVDARDPYITNGKDLPEGQADPDILIA